MADAFKKAYEEPEFKELAAKLGLGLAYQDGKEFGEFLAQNYKDVKEVMDQLGLSKKK